MRKLVFILGMLMSGLCSAEYTSYQSVERLSVVKNYGFFVAGNFGKPLTCELENTVFVSVSHPQYDQLYSLALAAFASGYKVRFEVRKCATIGWISGKPVAILDESETGEMDIVK